MAVRIVMHLFSCLAACVLAATCDKNADSPEPVVPDPKPVVESGYDVGDVFHQWEKGCLDFHGVSTGRGECWILILPDGTSVLIDAGETKAGNNSVPQRPNVKTAPHETIQQYLLHFLPATGDSRLDYMFLTHFHIDHMGTTEFVSSTANDYIHMGMSAVYDKVPCRRLIDRGWPDYGDNPKIGYFDMTGSTSTCTSEWIKFAQYIFSQGVPVEMFSVGATDQFVMTKGGGYDCEVKNIVGNGYYVTASGSVTSQSVDGENPCSCGIHVRYGKFDLITCGDLSSGPQNRMASYAIGTVPARKLEVFKGNHHLNSNSWGSGMTNELFSPRVVLAESFTKTDDSHITVSILEKAVSKSEAVFLSNAHPESVTQYPLAYSSLTGYDGHFVVRVFPTGEFYVFKLNDQNFEYRIVAKYGPFTCL